MFYFYPFGVKEEKLRQKKYEMKITNLICHDFITQQSSV